jgi:hypothetical protein
MKTIGWLLFWWACSLAGYLLSCGVRGKAPTPDGLCFNLAINSALFFAVKVDEIKRSLDAKRD